MMIEFLLQFAMEVVRALLADELLRRVRSIARQSGDMPRTLAGLHRRNSDRLLNRLRTDRKDEG